MVEAETPRVDRMMRIAAWVTDRYEAFGIDLVHGVHGVEEVGSRVSYTASKMRYSTAPEQHSTLAESHRRLLSQA